MKYRYIIPKLKSQRTQFILRFTVFRIGKASNVRFKKRIFYSDGKRLYYNICQPLYADKSPLPVFIYLHGGGWVSGNPDSRVSFVSNIAAMGFFTVNIFYGYAPEFCHPYAVENIYNALLHLKNNADLYNIDLNRIYVGGESAGAYLSAVLGAISSNEDYKKHFNLPDSVKDLKFLALMLNCGVYDFRSALKSEFKNIKSYIEAYYGKPIEQFPCDINAKYLMPIDFITSKFPKTFIVSAEKDKLNLESYQLEQALNEHLVENIHFHATGLNAIHGFAVATYLKNSKNALAAFYKFISQE